MQMPRVTEKATAIIQCIGHTRIDTLSHSTRCPSHSTHIGLHNIRIDGNERKPEGRLACHSLQHAPAEHPPKLLVPKIPHCPVAMFSASTTDS